MEKVQKNKQKQQREIMLMNAVAKKGAPGFPSLIFHKSDQNFYYIVMEMLGKSFKDIRDEMPGNKLTLKQVTQVGL